MHHHPIFFWHPKKKKFCQFYKFLFTSSSSALILIFLSSYTLTLVKCFNSHRMLDSTTNLSKAWQMVFWRIMPGTWCESDISILSDNSPSSFKKFSEIIHSPLYAKKEWENYSFFQSHGCSKCNFCMNLMPKKFFIFLFFYFSLHTFGFVLPAMFSFPRHGRTLSVDTSPLWEKIELQGAKNTFL